MADENNLDIEDEELEDLNLDEKPGGEGAELTVEELKAANEHKTVLLKKAIENKKRWRERAIDPKTGKLWADANKNDSSLQPTTTDKPSDDLVKDVQELKIEREKRQFAYQHHLSPEETDFIFTQPVPTGKERKDLLENPFVKGGLQAVRSEQEQAGATPRPSNRLPKVEGKTFEEMKPEERSRNWSKLTGVKTS